MLAGTPQPTLRPGGSPYGTGCVRRALLASHRPGGWVTGESELPPGVRAVSGRSVERYRHVSEVPDKSHLFLLRYVDKHKG